MKKILLTLILLSTLFAAGIGQSVYYVAPDGDDSNNGLTWTTAKQTVQAALEVSTANNGDEIWVAQGGYILTSQLEMKEGVNVYGGFAGTETSLAERPELTYGETAAGQASILNANASESSQRRVLNQSFAFATETTWDGFVLKNGYTNSSGGGAYLKAGGKLNNCNITNNRSGYDGGGVYCYQGGTLTNCNISNNNCSTDGGGVCCMDGGTLTNCNIINNTANNDGGGVAFFSGVALTNCNISNNRASSSGGGIYCYQGGIFTNCNISNNAATGPSSHGGGVLFYQSGTTFINCNIINNTASYGGSGVYCVFGVNTISNCIIWGNAITLYPNNPYQIQMNTGAAIVTYSAIQGGYTGENNINLEVENFGTDTDKFYPFFANPTTFAGPAINTSDSLAVVNADWQIMNGSACVDVGNPDTTGLYISNIDIAGNSRIMNCRIDIGAYEMQDGGRLQTLDLGNLLTDLRYGGESIGLPGETNEGIAIIYSSSDEGIAAINDNTLEIISGGIFRLTVTAPAINGYCEYARVIEVQIQNVPISTPGPVIYVKPRDSGSGDGSSWENATSNIQAALNASELVIGEKPKIWVAQGEYILAAELIMKEGVNVYGGFIGTETSLTDRPELTYGETASGQASILNANASESSMRCVLNQSIAFTTETTWDGFVLKNGYADNGGGAYLRASGKLNNCIISNNTASNGGGVYCNQGGILTNCNITNNSAITYSGGGIYCNQGGTMTNCIISNNTSSYSGGGVYCYSGSILNNCEISNNTSQYGGGVYCYFIDILTNCNIINNTASSYGGGVFCSFGGTLTNCNITNNSTTGSNGGGVYCSSGGTLTNCIIWSNKKGEDFEQIYVYSGPTVVTYCAVQDGYTGDSNISLNAENSGTDENNFYPFFANPTTFVGVATNSAGRLAIANADWRITGESACVNIGIADTTGLNIPDTDIAGNPRIVNDRIDIGVYEYDGITLSQTITWEQTFYGFYITSEPVELTATASSSLTVNYISSNENVAIIINGNELQIIGAGSANITAVQPGNENYFPAQSITKTINVLNNDATLSNLTVSEGVLDPEFDPQTFTYTVNVEPEVETIEISATPGDSNATISEDSDTGTQSLDYGENIFSIMVTAEDGETSEIYTVKVVRENYSIVENINAAKIEVYPNPAKEQLKISIADNSKIITVEISDVQGQLLNTIKLNNDETIVNISSLPAGIYFVKIVTDKTTEIKKIIIQ